jgi:hypothetical protein
MDLPVMPWTMSGVYFWLVRRTLLYQKFSFQLKIGLDMNIAVPGSDLEKIGAESIKVPGQPDQYIAGLGVFHELHCLVSRIYALPFAGSH